MPAKKRWQRRFLLIEDCIECSHSENGSRAAILFVAGCDHPAAGAGDCYFCYFSQFTLTPGTANACHASDIRSSEFDSDDMNILSVCTLTGADDTIQPEDLFRLSAEFPFVEWGILYHEALKGAGRYPAFKWIDVLCDQMPRYPTARFALHVCGREAVNLFLLGTGNVSRTASCFDRVQINFIASNFDQ